MLSGGPRGPAGRLVLQHPDQLAVNAFVAEPMLVAADRVFLTDGEKFGYEVAR
jgi:hypothetical protein